MQGSGRCLEGVCRVLARYPGGVWKMSGRCPGECLESGRCLEGVWRVPRVRLEGAWRVSARCLKESGTGISET